MFSSLTHTLRGLARSPGFTGTALGTLALCIGANITIFAVIDSVLLRPLPFPQSDQLVTLYNTYPKAGVDRDGSSVTNYYERRGNIAAFSSLAIFRSDTAVIGEPGSTERVDLARVSPDFFSTLGASPSIGRSFHEDETTYQTDSVVILTDSYWRKHFTADPNILDREVRLDGVAKKVVGVLPPHFGFLSSTARVYLPYASDSNLRGPQNRHSGNSITIVARLKAGATLSDAQSQIDAHNASVADSYPHAAMIGSAGFRSVVASLHGDHVKGIRPVLLLLQGGVLLLLLIGGVNLMNLLLIRASGRAREVAIRVSMGATRWHLIRDVALETILLTLVGTGAAMLVASFGIELIAQFGAERLPLGATLALDSRTATAAIVGAFTFGLVLAAPIVWFNLRSQLAPALQAGTRGATVGRATQRLRHAFIVTQIALAFILLAGAGLLGLSLERAMSVAPGFQSDNVISGQLTLPRSAYHERSALLSFADRLLAEINTQPGVVSAALATNIPLSGIKQLSAVQAKGRVLQAGETHRGHYAYGVTGNYFSTLGIPLQQGRFLDRDDAQRPVRVCVVDEDFAHLYWPQGNAVGQGVFLGGGTHTDDKAFTIVGVVGSVHQSDLTENSTTGMVYFPLQHRSDLHLFTIVRSRQSPELLGAALQTLVRRIDPDLPLDDIRTMETRVTDSLVTRRTPALLATIFAAIALILAAIGTYGVLAYGVNQRRREIGVRMALGALPRQVLVQFLKLGARLLFVALALGMLGTWAVGRTMQTMLFGVGALHFGVLATTAGVMIAIVFVAMFLPSRRAARINPIEALRAE